MARLRRFVLILAFAAWQGGFVFYAGVVVPTGSGLLGHFRQGLVTQRVTNGLNLLGLACHAAYLWELLAVGERRKWRWGAWGASLLLLGGLAAVHLKLDSLIGSSEESLPAEFRRWHMLYLWASTIHWAVWLGLVWLTLPRGRDPAG